MPAVGLGRGLDGEQVDEAGWERQWHPASEVQATQRGSVAHRGQKMFDQTKKTHSQERLTAMCDRWRRYEELIRSGEEDQLMKMIRRREDMNAADGTQGKTLVHLAAEHGGWFYK